MKNYWKYLIYSVSMIAFGYGYMYGMLLAYEKLYGKI